MFSSEPSPPRRRWVQANLLDSRLRGNDVRCKWSLYSVAPYLGWRLAKENAVRIIPTSNFYPSSGFAANKDLAPEVIQKITTALIDFEPTGKDKTGLYHWERTEMASGFAPARDEDYEEMRQTVIRLGLRPIPGEGQPQCLRSKADDQPEGGRHQRDRGRFARNASAAHRRGHRPVVETRP